MRPYGDANFTPHLLSLDRERALKPGDSFQECAKDCPEMVVLPAGEFMDRRMMRKAVGTKRVRSISSL
jgi:hypothetical protein